MNGPQLSAHLAALGLSKSAFARDIGVSRRCVVYWCAGARKVPAHARAVVYRSVKRGYWVTPRRKPPPGA